MATFRNNDIARAIYLGAKGKTGKELGDFLNNTARFLFKRRLGTKTPDILKRLDKMIKDEEGVIGAKVYTAHPLSESGQREINHFLKRKYKAESVVLEEKINKELLGGVKIEINDEVIDLTLRNKIFKLQQHLTKTV